MMRPSLLVSLLFIISASASPKGRLKVKYRVKPGGDKVMVKTVTEEGVAEKTNVEEVLTNKVDGDALMMEARDLLMASTPDSYKQTVTTIVGQLQRAARSQDLSVNYYYDSLPLQYTITIHRETQSTLSLQSDRNSTLSSSDNDDSDDDDVD